MANPQLKKPPFSAQNTDRLDTLGAIGFAGTFAYSGKKGQLIFDPGIPVRENLTLDEYRNGKSTTINHFHEKLFKLPKLMNRDYAKETAMDRINFMKNFIDQFMAEWESLSYSFSRASGSPGF